MIGADANAVIGVTIDGFSPAEVAAKFGLTVAGAS